MTASSLRGERPNGRLDVRSRIRSVSVRVDVVPDVADPVSKMPIQVNESEFEALRQKRTDRALSRPAGAD